VRQGWFSVSNRCEKQGDDGVAFCIAHCFILCYIVRVGNVYCRKDSEVWVFLTLYPKTLGIFVM